MSNHAPPGAAECKNWMVCFCTSASSAAGLVLSVMASVCARANWAAGIAASIGREDMNHEFIQWLRIQTSTAVGDQPSASGAVKALGKTAFE